MRINIEDVIKNIEERRRWNTANLEEIEFIKDGQKIMVAEKILKEFAYTGLLTTDFVQMYDWEKGEW